MLGLPKPFWSRLGHLWLWRTMRPLCPLQCCHYSYCAWMQLLQGWNSSLCRHLQERPKHLFCLLNQMRTLISQHFNSTTYTSWILEYSNKNLSLFNLYWETLFRGAWSGTRLRAGLLCKADQRLLSFDAHRTTMDASFASMPSQVPWVRGNNIAVRKKSFRI